MAAGEAGCGDVRCLVWDILNEVLVGHASGDAREAVGGRVWS